MALVVRFPPHRDERRVHGKYDTCWVSRLDHHLFCGAPHLICISILEWLCAAHSTHMKHVYECGSSRTAAATTRATFLMHTPSYRMNVLCVFCRFLSAEFTTCTRVCNSAQTTNDDAGSRPSFICAGARRQFIMNGGNGAFSFCMRAVVFFQRAFGARIYSLCVCVSMYILYFAISSRMFQFV